uniref:Uncharacterized protein n=1 Tax=Arundo donax TaxID=35708 RepID=A0A0A8YU33_ARUDO
MTDENTIFCTLFSRNLKPYIRPGIYVYNQKLISPPKWMST